MPKDLLLAVDQGTTGTRTYVFDRRGRVLGSAYQEFAQYFPQPGWVEHDALEIWASVQRTGAQALKSAGVSRAQAPERIAGLGITNQRETVALWDRRSSRPIHRAIVWQCRRTAARCEQLKRQGREGAIRSKTGLLLDAYFSATKVEWLLRQVPGAMAKAKAGRLAMGTMDSWLLWNLSGGRAHASDYTNASRTLLYDIRKKRWDPDLLKLFGVPASLLPSVQASASRFGVTAAKAFCGPGIPINGIAGDQQSALFGQGCVGPGQMKNTYGTGCFLLLNIGKRFQLSKNKLLTTLACDAAGQPVYALEGAVFAGGAAVQWVRDGLGLVKSAAETEKICRSLKDNGGVHLVPAFVGLGAPHWDSAARACISGLTRGSSSVHVVRAAVESMAFQSGELLQAMEADAGVKLRTLRVDGGASRNNWLMQFQADLLGAAVERPKMTETTALGAALLAGIGCGLIDAEQGQQLRKIDKRFLPRGSARWRSEQWSGWKKAVRMARTR